MFAPLARPGFNHLMESINIVSLIISEHVMEPHSQDSMSIIMSIIMMFGWKTEIHEGDEVAYRLRGWTTIPIGRL